MLYPNRLFSFIGPFIEENIRCASQRLWSRTHTHLRYVSIRELRQQTTNLSERIINCIADLTVASSLTQFLKFILICLRYIRERKICKEHSTHVLSTFFKKFGDFFFAKSQNWHNTVGSPSPVIATPHFAAAFSLPQSQHINVSRIR